MLWTLLCLILHYKLELTWVAGVMRAVDNKDPASCLDVLKKIEFSVILIIYQEVRGDRYL